MIVCRTCSRRHPDGTEFCVCGAYLEFDGEHIPDAAPPAPPASQLPPPPGQPPPGQPPADRPTASRPAASRPATTRAPKAAEPAPWSGFEPAPAQPARPPGGIDAVLPDAPVQPAATQPVFVESGARAGDTVCRLCGTANGPERFFCRHCGAALSGALDPAAAAAPRPIPWWRRAARRARAKAGATDATTVMNRAHGLSRGGLSGRTMLFRTGGVMVVLAGLLAFLGPWRGPVVAKARELIGAERHDTIDVAADEVESVPTDPAIAPADFPLQDAANVVDRFANTAWATRWLDPVGPGFETAPTDEGCQPTPMTDSQLVVSFAEPRDIGRIRVLGGRPDGDEARTLFRRPRVLEVQVDDEPCTYLVLDDVGELVTFDIGRDDVSTVTIRIVGVFEPDAPSEVVEISEVLFEE